MLGLDSWVLESRCDGAAEVVGTVAGARDACVRWQLHGVRCRNGPVVAPTLAPNACSRALVLVGLSQAPLCVSGVAAHGLCAPQCNARVVAHRLAAPVCLVAVPCAGGLAC